MLTSFNQSFSLSIAQLTASQQLVNLTDKDKTDEEKKDEEKPPTDLENFGYVSFLCFHFH